MPQFYFDAHCDTLSRLTHTGASIQDNDFHISLKKASVFAHYAQIFAIFNDAGAAFMKTRGTPMEFSTRLRAGEDVLDYDGVYKGYLAQRDTLRALLAQEENRLALCLSADDIERAWAEGKHAAILAMNDSTFLHIFTGRPIDYFSAANAAEIREKALELISSDRYDLISIHTFEYDDAAHAYGPESKEALNAVSIEAEIFAQIACEMKKFAGRHRMLLSYSPDHGQHLTEGGTGAHGSKMAEDMNILHFWGAF